MYVRQALGQNGNLLGGDPGGTTPTFSGTKTGEETKTIGSSGPSFWDRLKEGFQAGLSTGIETGLRPSQPAPSPGAPVQPQGTPTWVWPLVIGGGVLAVVIAVRRK